MNILHLSDFHFRSPACVDPDRDPDQVSRTSVLNDVADRVRVLGNIDVVLLGGDIAFAGQQVEYDSAYSWLQKLSKICSCPIENMYVVPGNHDVDQSIIRSQKAVQNAQNVILAAPQSVRHKELQSQLADPDAAKALLSPLSAYNGFAGRLDCQTLPDRIFWIHTLPLNEHIKLKLYGLNSALLSGAGTPRGEIDRAEMLLLGKFQAIFDPQRDTVNLVICHHPPEWLSDGEEIRDAFNERAPLQFFGHKHKSRHVATDDFITFAAGAITPDPNEPGSVPAYNIVQLNVGIEGSKYVLDVTTHRYVWQENPDKFRELENKHGDTVFSKRLPLNYDVVVSQPENEVTVQHTELPYTKTEEVEDTLSKITSRNLIARFWDLKPSDQRTISKSLGLLSDEEIIAE